MGSVCKYLVEGESSGHCFHSLGVFNARWNYYHFCVLCLASRNVGSKPMELDCKHCSCMQIDRARVVTPTSLEANVPARNFSRNTFFPRPEKSLTCLNVFKRSFIIFTLSLLSASP